MRATPTWEYSQPSSTDLTLPTLSSHGSSAADSPAFSRYVDAVKALGIELGSTRIKASLTGPGWADPILLY